MANPAQLIGLLSGLNGGGTDAPESLPSLDLPQSAPLPYVPQGEMPGPVDPRPPQDGHVGGMHIVRDLAPMIMSMIAGIRNPMHGAAIANGMAQGALQAQQERLGVQQHEDRLRTQGIEFMRQTAADVMRLKDPMERQKYLQFAHDIGVQQFKLPTDWTTKIPAHDGADDVFGKLKGELSSKLAAFDKDKKWATVAGTPQEGKISFRLSNGQTVPVNKARQLVGQAVFDTATGGQAFAPTAPEGSDGKSDEAQYRRVLIQEFTEKNKRPPNTSELRGIYEDAKSGRRAAPVTGSFEDYLKRQYGDAPTPGQITKARREYGDAGRAAPVVVNVPGGGNVTDQIETGARSVLEGRMAPSQVVSLYGGYGKEGAAFKRALATRIQQMDPTFNFQEAESNYQYGKNTGVQASIRYMTSVQDSIPMLLERAKTLNNGNVRGINALVNAGKDQFNNVDLKRFKTDVTLVADEVAKILQGGGTGSATSDAKLRQASALLSESDSPAAIAASLADINTLIGFRKEAQTAGTYRDKSKRGGGGDSGGDVVEEWVRDPKTGRMVKKGKN